MGDRILTLHPDPDKQGTNISRLKYDQMKAAILDILAQESEMSFSALGDAVGARLEGTFQGSIGWYFTTVKLDLEARGLLERVTGSRPQRLRLVNST